MIFYDVYIYTRQQMPVGSRQVAASSMLLMAESIVRLTIVATVSFWIARKIGPGQFGVLNFASALVAIMMSLATMGLDAPVIMRLTQTQDQGVIIGAVLLLRAIAGFIALVFAVMLAYLLKSDDPLALTVTLIVSTSILLNLFSVFDYWFKANTVPLRPAMARVVGTTLSAIAKIACLVLGLGIVALAWTVALEALLTSVGMVVAYVGARGRNEIGSWLLIRKTAVTLARESWSYMLSAFTVVAYLKVDVVMLGYMSSNLETGVYSLAQKLSEILYIIPIVLIDSAYPSLSRRYLDSGMTDKAHGQRLFDLAIGGSMMATIMAVLLVNPLVMGIFGDHYSRSINIFYVHAWSCVAIGMNSARHNWMATTGLQRYAPIVTVIGLVVNVVMNFVLIPALGALGAAISTVVSYFLSGYLSSFIFTALYEIGYIQTRALWPWARLYAGIKESRCERVST